MIQRILVAAIGVTCLLSAGCSGDDSPTATATNVPTQATVVATEVTGAGAPPTPTPTPEAVTFLRDEAAEPPTVIFFNGQVVTIEDVLPLAEAIAISGNSIVAIGDNDSVMALSTAETQVIDLEGRALLPGFVDPHNHVYNAVFLGQEPETVGTSFAEAEERLLRAGTTTVANPNIWPEALAAFLAFAEEGLRIRTSLYPGYNDNCGNPWPADWYREYPPLTDPKAMLRFPGIKVFTDGGSCGAIALTVGPAGDLFIESEELADVIESAQAQGYQVAIHALGDRAVDTTLDALEMALGGEPNSYRHRIEHNRLIRPDQRPRYGEIGAIPVVFGQPYTCQILDGGPWSFLNGSGPAIALRSWLDNHRALIEANPGLPVAWKSDAPSNFPYEPLLHLWSLVTRDARRADGSLCEAPAWLEEGGVSVEQALRMMTTNAAYVLFMEERIGSLRPGKFADVIVLSESPLTADPATIADIEVLITMVNGRAEYCEENHASICPD